MLNERQRHGQAIGNGHMSPRAPFSSRHATVFRMSHHCTDPRNAQDTGIEGPAWWRNKYVTLTLARTINVKALFLPLAVSTRTANLH